MGLFQSIADTPVNMQFIPPPPVQMYQPHGAPQVAQGTPSPGTDALMKGIGMSPGATGGGAAAGTGAEGAAAAGGSSGLMAAIMQMLPMFMGG